MARCNNARKSEQGGDRTTRCLRRPRAAFHRHERSLNAGTEENPWHSSRRRLEAVEGWIVVDGGRLSEEEEKEEEEKTSASTDSTAT